MFYSFEPKDFPHLIDAIWVCDSDIDPNEGHIAPPSVGCQLIIKLYQSNFETILSGPFTQQKRYPYVAGARYFGVQLAPNVGTLINQFALKELKDQSADVSRLLNIDLSQLAYQLQESTSWDNQIKLIVQMMQKKELKHDNFLNPNLLYAIDILTHCHGNISVKRLASQVAISQRQLERLFLRHTGITPKIFSTILRIKQVLKHLDEKEPMPLAQLALACGYADQSHMANDFKHTLGTSIKQYQANTVQPLTITGLADSTL